MNNSWVICDNLCSLQKLIFLIFGCLTLLVCCSCATSRIPNHASRIEIDTVYLSNTQYDSIYIYKDRYQDRSKDTVYLKNVSIEHRYKLLRDTVKIIQHDSIPYEVTIVETKEITRPLTWFDHLTRATFWLLCGTLFVLFVKLFRKLHASRARSVFKLKKH